MHPPYSIPSSHTTRTRDHQVVLSVAGLICVVAGLLFSVYAYSPALLRYVYPTLAFGLGLYFYRISPPLYLGFTWWIWFLTPFVRRVIDIRAGYLDINPTMLAPFLVTLVCGLAVWQYFTRLRTLSLQPFLLLGAALFYGYLVGLFKAGLFSATYGVVQWLCPVLLGFYLAVTWHNYPAYRRTIRRVFGWGVLVMGTYGILQFFFTPLWDQYWIYAANMGSIGKPYPTQFRVFSTLNAPGPFAQVMMVGLVLLLTSRGLARMVAAVPGVVSLMLSLVRSAWGGGVLAVGLIFLRSPGSSRVRSLALILIGGVLALPVLTSGLIGDRVGQRVATFTGSQIGEDNSLRARANLYRTQTLDVLANPLGDGVGSTGTARKLSAGDTASLDSGLLVLMAQLGWIGGGLYILGMGALIRQLWRFRRMTDPFAIVCTSIVLVLLVELVFGAFLSGVKGTLLWTFLGLGLASVYHHQAQAE